MKRLLEDINFGGFTVSQNGRSITLVFRDVSQGLPYARIVVEGVQAFNYHNAFDLQEDGLSTFVAEVSASFLDSKDSEKTLLRLGYGFLGKGTNVFSTHRSQVFIHLEGGEIEINLIGESYQLFMDN